MRRTYLYRLYPNAEQQVALETYSLPIAPAL